MQFYLNLSLPSQRHIHPYRTNGQGLQVGITETAAGEFTAVKSAVKKAKVRTTLRMF